MIFSKVSVRQNSTMHLTKDADRFTLCGLEWFFTNDHGELYCQKCQYIYANRERLLIRRKPVSRHMRAGKRSEAARRKLYKVLGLS